jgi:hypothetical protein
MGTHCTPDFNIMKTNFLYCMRNFRTPVSMANYILTQYKPGPTQVSNQESISLLPIQSHGKSQGNNTDSY